MQPEVYLEHYRLGRSEDEAMAEIVRNGPAITYKGSDVRSGAPVALTLIPITSVDPAEREQFEENARAAMLLDHAHIAKTVAFGSAGENFVVVSELPQGETVQAWVAAHGAMPADSVVRIALQVVAALGAASFHGLTHPAIQPSNMMIVSGKTAEGGWPFIKLTHFALAGLKSAPGQTDPDLNASDFASPEQLLEGKVDFRSEIYSLGATMCFLLTGVLYSAHPRWPQTKRFLRPLRTLIARTLQDDPAERPQDPILFTEELRNCLVKVEQRQIWERKLGMSFLAVVKKQRRRVIVRESDRGRRGLKTVLASVSSSPADETLVIERDPFFSWRSWAIAAALLLGGGIVAAMLLPEDVVTSALHRKKSIETIGVPVGVPEALPAAIAQTNVNNSPARQPSETAAAPVAAQAPTAPAVKFEPLSSTAPVVAQNSSPAPAANVAANENNAATPTADSAAAPRSTLGPWNDQTRPLAANAATPEPMPPAEPPSSSGPRPNEPTEEPQVTPTDEPTHREVAQNDSERDSAESVKKGDAESPTTTSQTHTKSANSGEHGRTRSSKSRLTNAAAHARSPHGRTFRARVVAVTPNGNVVLVLPSGERAIVSPDDVDRYTEPNAPVQGPIRRAIVPRRTIYVPPDDGPIPPYQPFIPPD
jgi:serine/threonine protein kinase